MFSWLRYLKNHFFGKTVWIFDTRWDAPRRGLAKEIKPGFWYATLYPEGFSLGNPSFWCHLGDVGFTYGCDFYDEWGWTYEQCLNRHYCIPIEDLYMEAGM